MTLADLWMRLLSWVSYLFGYRTLRRNKIGRGERVVVVGGGFAGVTAVHYLEATTDYQIVLYDKKDYFEYTPSMLRVIVEPDHINQSHLRYSDIPWFESPRIQFIHDEVVAITEHGVKGKTSEWVKYDKLILAMGSDYHDHIKPDEGSTTLKGRKQQVAEIHSRIVESPIIDIFGAGLVGVELAAEIAEKWPEKKVILRSREPHTLPGFPAKAQDYVLHWMEKHNVEVILNNSIPPWKYEPKAGELVFNCTGLMPVVLESMFHKNDANTNSTIAPPAAAKKLAEITIPAEMGKPLSWAAHVDSRNQLLRTTKEMHLLGHSNIFVIGDIMIEDHLLNSPDLRAPNVAYQAELQAWVVTENIKRQVEGRLEWDFPEDVAGTETYPTIIDCSLGTNDGMSIFNDIVITGRSSAWGKHFLETSKMMLLRGYFIGEFIWTLVDPMTLIFHRLHLGVKSLFSKKVVVGVAATNHQ